MSTLRKLANSAAALSIALLALVLPAPAQQLSSVFVVPEPSQGGNLSIYNSNPFAFSAMAATVQDPAFLLVNPNGTRVYVIGASGTVSVLDATAAFVEVARYSLASQVRSAIITPDGRKMLILAGTMRVIDLAVDRPQTVPQVDVGPLPDDVAVSLDSARAYVVSGVGRTITVIDLTNNQRLAQRTIPGTPGGIAVGPNGLIYAATSNVLYELDWQDGLIFTETGGFTFLGEPSRPIFTPDGRNVVVGTRPNDGESSVIQIDLATRAVTSVTGPANLTNLTMGSNNRAFATAGGLVYVTNVAPLQPPGQAAIGALSGTVGVAVSDEAPTARFLFGQTNNTLYRIDLTGGSFAGPNPTISAARTVVFGASPSRSPVAALQRTATPASVAPGDPTYPMAVRAVDGMGRPVVDALIQFSTSVAGLVLPTTSARTNAQGLASVSGTAPAAAGTFLVRASTGGAGVDIPIEVSTAASVERRFSIFRGQGQAVTAGSTAVSFQVQFRDELGNPVPSETVEWGLESGFGIAAVTMSSTTDSQGVATGIFSTEVFTPVVADQFRPFTVQASISSGTVEASISFFGVILPVGGGINVQLTTSLTPTEGAFPLPAGATVFDAFQAQVFSRPPIGSGLLPAPVPNVGIRTTVQEMVAASVSCADDPVTSASGTVTCDLVVGSGLGRGTMDVILGELAGQTFQYQINVIPGAPTSITVIQGDGQSGAPDTVTPIALVVEVKDLSGNVLRNVEITWSVASGSGFLVNPRNVTDNNGRASTQVRYGPLPGTVTIRAASGALATNFTLTNTAGGGGTLTIQSGSGQSAPVNTAFPSPLSVQLTSGDGQPITGSIINFAPTGPVVLSAASATTNMQGIASVSAQAGATAGTATVRASTGAANVTFNLNVTPPGPRIDSLLNGASFLAGASPCAVGVVQGSFGIPADTVLTSSIGPITILASTLGGISVQVNGQMAPIYYTSNIGGVQQVGIQIPCETAAGTAALRVDTSGASSTLNVTIADVAPGIFESAFSGALRQGVAIRSNGTYITPSNPARTNETITGFFTGLGAAVQAQGTNALGIGQTIPLDRIIIGLNNQGMPSVSAAYAPNMIGVWAVSFMVLPEAGVGERQVYAIGVRNAQGQVVYGQGSALPVRAQ